jgi:hypothetical protein
MQAYHAASSTTMEAGTRHGGNTVVAQMLKAA